MVKKTRVDKLLALMADMTHEELREFVKRSAEENHIYITSQIPTHYVKGAVLTGRLLKEKEEQDGRDN